VALSINSVSLSIIAICFCARIRSAAYTPQPVTKTRSATAAAVCAIFHGFFVSFFRIGTTSFWVDWFKILSLSSSEGISVAIRELCNKSSKVGFI